MARRLRINNPDLTRSEKTYLTSAYTSGTTLNVSNSFAFSANNFAVVGEPGKDEVIESERITGVGAANNSITIASALDFDYSRDQVVYQSRYDQIEIESRNSSSDVWAVITTSGIQWDKLQTLYTDANGIETTQYRWRFKNSSISSYSEYSPTLTGAGFTPAQVGYIVREVRLLSGDLDGRIKKDKEITRDIDRSQEIIYGMRRDWWFLRFEDSSITASADTDKYNLDLIGGGSALNPGITLGRLDTVRYKYNDGSTNITYHMEFLPNIEFDQYVSDNTEPTDDYAIKYTILDPDASSTNGYIRIYPKTRTTGYGTFIINGYQKPPTVNSVEDAVLIPLPSIIIDYCIAQLEKVRGNDSKASYYEELFWGPAPSQQNSRRLSGVALLEQLNAEQRRPQGQPRQLIRFAGRGSVSRMFGNKFINRDSIHEKYW